MTEIDKNVLQEIEQNKKVEVVVKRDSSTHGEFDLVRVFSNMGKKRRIFVCIILACMLIGLATPLLMAELKDRGEKVSVLLNMVYPAAKKQLAPDGSELDINYIKSSYILQKALKMTHLSENIPISALERNINIESLLTEETRQKLEVAEKVIQETKKDYEQVLEVDYQYEGKYIITISNGFSTDPEARNKTYLESSEMSALINNIAEAYIDYFYETYMDMMLPDNTLGSINNEELDYIERLDEIVNLLDSLSTYCTETVKSQYLSSRSRLDGMTFQDIADCIKLIRDIDVDYLYAYVFYNNIAKDKKSMVTKYSYQLKNTERELNVVNGNIAYNSQLISEYKNDKINISSNDQEVMQESLAVTDYYNNLIMDQSENYKKKASLGEKIANLNDKIAGFKTTTSSQTQIEYVENELKSLVETCTTLYNLTEDHANEILESDSYKNSFINYIGAQLSKDSFFNSTNIKNAIIGLLAGAFLGALIWGTDGIIEEFKKNSSSKNALKEGEAKA
ncbi:MAG: hypothetical protein K6E47_03605 [Lachnospiraceae bacterium]|nr:hypothetical protein [Lachnospiraceae bacterium]